MFIFSTHSENLKPIVRYIVLFVTETILMIVLVCQLYLFTEAVCILIFSYCMRGADKSLAL
jgi:hypothetical protein